MIKNEEGGRKVSIAEVPSFAGLTYGSAIDGAWGLPTALLQTTA